MLQLPDEILRKIVTSLHTHHLIMVGSACKHIHKLNIWHLLIPLQLECYFDADEYFRLTPDEIIKERQMLQQCDISIYYSQAKKCNVTSRLIFLYEMIYQLETIMGEVCKKYNSALKHYSTTPSFPSFYKNLLRHPRNNDYPHWIINKVRRLGGTEADVNYSRDKQFQLSFCALVY